MILGSSRMLNALLYSATSKPVLQFLLKPRAQHLPKKPRQLHTQCLDVGHVLRIPLEVVASIHLPESSGLGFRVETLSRKARKTLKLQIHPKPLNLGAQVFIGAR